MTLEKLESRRTLKVKRVRLSDDDLDAIIKRVNSSRSIQWWKDDIKQLLYEVKCLKDENATLTTERDALRVAVAEMAAVKPRGLLARWLVDRARRALGE